MSKTVKLLDGTVIPIIGQGTWFLGEDKNTIKTESEALIAGVAAGMTLIDTAEMYGDGKAEKLIGMTLSELDRSKLFIVSKVFPHNAGKNNIFKSCKASLERMGIDYIDLYLLHWRGSIPLEETVECMEKLIDEGKIRRWGVSNFDIGDMEELWNVPNGNHCVVNQVLYNIASRGIEYDLLPWMNHHNIPVMAYCPLAQGGDLVRNLYKNKVLKKIADQHDASLSQILLAWNIRSGNVIAIPRTSSAKHAVENSKAMDITLTYEELSIIDLEYKAPMSKQFLDMV